jgi:hypothetical protein
MGSITLRGTGRVRHLVAVAVAQSRNTLGLGAAADTAGIGHLTCVAAISFLGHGTFIPTVFQGLDRFGFGFAAAAAGKQGQLRLGNVLSCTAVSDLELIRGNHASAVLTFH